MLTLTWVGRNKDTQSDVPVDHFAAGVTQPVGLQTVCKWYWRVNAVGGGITHHYMGAMRGAPGYTQKVRNMTGWVTDNAID